MLQFLQYRQQLEKDDQTKHFQSSQNVVIDPQPTVDSNVNPDSDPDEEAIEKSLKVWYGLNVNGASNVFHASSLMLAIIPALISSAMRWMIQP